jgi:hypothetical protein
LDIWVQRATSTCFALLFGAAISGSATVDAHIAAAARAVPSARRSSAVGSSLAKAKWHKHIRTARIKIKEVKILNDRDVTGCLMPLRKTPLRRFRLELVVDSGSREAVHSQT